MNHAPIEELKDLGGILERNKDGLAKSLTASTQVPISFANRDVEYAIYILKNFEILPKKLKADGIELEDRAGVGKIAVLLPYNMPAWSFALSFSNAFYFKENSVKIKVPSTCEPFYKKLTEILEGTRFLKNKDGTLVFSDVPGKDFIKDMISANTDVVQIYGRPNYLPGRVRYLAMEHGTTLILEGPGNNPGIVSNDANLEEAAKTMAELRTTNSGQVCMGLEQLFVQKDVYENFTKLLFKELDKKVVGLADEEKTDVGPIMNSVADAAESVLKEAMSNGARIVYENPPAGIRGNRPVMDTWTFQPCSNIKGYKHVPIVVLEGVTSKHKMPHEERFCTVLPVSTYETDLGLMGELCERRFRLAATFYGDNSRRTHEDLLNLLHVNFGNVFVNRCIYDPQKGYDVIREPCGGFGDSRFKISPGDILAGKRKMIREEGPTYWALDFSKQK